MVDPRTPRSRLRDDELAMAADPRSRRRSMPVRFLQLIVVVDELLIIPSLFPIIMQSAQKGLTTA